jgi:hypothetical protein
VAAGTAQAGDRPCVSTMSTSVAGTTIIRNGGTLPSSTMQWATNQSACSHPLANAHRPLVRKPPSTIVATPVGLNVPATTTSGPSAYTPPKDAVGSRPRIIGAELPIITVQPTDPSAVASSRRSCRCSVRSASAPPKRCGTSIRKHPAERRRATRSRGSRRPRSISSLRVTMSGVSRRTAASTVAASDVGWLPVSSVASAAVGVDVSVTM